MKTALITGITGQDGSYLADLLLAHGYRVVGTRRPDVALNDWRIRHILDRIEFAECDFLDEASVREVVERQRPDEIYNLGARASSSHLFESPVLTAEYNGIAVLRLLEAARAVNPSIRFCQASSSEIFGRSKESPQREATPFHPRNPYGVAKLAAHWYVVSYRENHDMFACSSILFNHESPRRGEEFVTRKITRAVARIKAGMQAKLQLGDLEARRDWGFAADYVEAMWRMLQAPAPDDYVVATGETHSVRELCDIAFSHVSLKYQDYVLAGAADRRPPESVQLVGDPSRAERVLGWRRSVSFEQLVRMMVDADLAALERGA